MTPTHKFETLSLKENLPSLYEWVTRAGSRGGTHTCCCKEDVKIAAADERMKLESPSRGREGQFSCKSGTIFWSGWTRLLFSDRGFTSFSRCSFLHCNGASTFQAALLLVLCSSSRVPFKPLLLFKTFRTVFSVSIGCRLGFLSCSMGFVRIATPPCFHSRNRLDLRGKTGEIYRICQKIGAAAASSVDRRSQTFAASLRTCEVCDR